MPEYSTYYKITKSACMFAHIVISLLVIIGTLCFTSIVFAQPGVAYNFGIDGNLLANSPSGIFLDTNDWLDGPAGIGIGVLNYDGTSRDFINTFHVVDGTGSNDLDVFVESDKVFHDPNTYNWGAGSVPPKDDIQNGLIHVYTDNNGDLWIAMAADRRTVNGDSYIDFEFLQARLYKNPDGTFTSLGPDGGRTVNDIIITIKLTVDGTNAQFFAQQWAPDPSIPGEFTYLDIVPPVYSEYVAANIDSMVAVPYGAFGQTMYGLNQFGEAGANLTELITEIDDCFGIATVFIRTKSSTSSTAQLKDLIEPIQLNVCLDETPPILVGCPADITVECLASVPPPAVVTAIDNCDNDVEVTILENDDGTTCPEVITRVWTAIDECGNATTCTQNIYFENCPAVESGTLLFSELYSTDASFISDPPPIQYIYNTKYVQVTRLPGEKIYLSGSPDAWTPLVVDDDILINGQHAGPGPYTVSENYPNPPYPPYPTDVPIETILNPKKADEIPESMIPVGSSCIRIDLVDTQREIYGNTNIYLYKTTDQPSNLTITCPGPISVECLAHVPAADANSVTVSSDCSGDIVVTLISEVSDGGNCPKIITRTYQATDDCGNQVTCSQTITIIDETPPELAGCPNNISVECLSDVPSPANVTAMDNCEGALSPTMQEVDDGGTCPRIISRTWTATDACGNSATCSQTITVDDDTAPVFSGCPADISYECYDEMPDYVDISAVDNCDGTVDIVFEQHSSGSTPIIVTRLWEATDNCGNTASCSQTITITDEEPPQLIGCPDDLIIECDGNIPEPAQVDAVDNCSEATIYPEQTQTNPGATCSNIITRTWTAEDAYGNAASCSQVITILGPPVCNIEPTQIDFGEISVLESREESFVISNSGSSALEGRVEEYCDVFSIVSGAGDFSLPGGESMIVTVRYAPDEPDTFSCLIQAGTYCDGVLVTGTAIAPIAVALQSYAASWEAGRVKVNWALRDVSGALTFEVLRAVGNGQLQLLQIPEIHRSGDQFTLYDCDVVPGERYTYQVGIKEDDLFTTSFETTITIPDFSFALHSAHPNPFKEMTTIDFSLPRAENVTLDVYDISGQRVATLVNRSLNGGDHSASWDGRDIHGKTVAAGIYFYRLKAGKQVLTRKMVLLK